MYAYRYRQSERFEEHLVCTLYILALNLLGIQHACNLGTV